MKRDLPDITPIRPQPWDMLDFAVGAGTWPRMLGSQSARAASAADLATPPPRPGSEDFLVCPSRFGNHLHHRDGRITDLAGKPVKPVN